VGTPVLSVGTAGSSHSIFDDILPRISGDKFFGIYSRDIDVPAGNIPGTYVAALGPLQDELRNTSSIIYQLKASFQYGAPTPMPTPMPTPTPTPTVQSQFVAQESIAIANLNAELDKVRNSQKVSVIKMKSLLIQLAGEIGTSAFLADFQDTHNTIASFLIHSYPAKKFLLCVKRNSPAGPLLDIVFPKTQKTKCPNGWTM